MYNCKVLVNKLQGLNTIEDIENKLNVKRATAIKYVHLLRKEGLVETKRGKGKKRLYRITTTPQIKIGNPGLYEILNENSPIKIWEPYEHRIIGRKLTIEEVIAWAASEMDLRIHIAVLALFKKVKNWQRLYNYAKLYKVRRKIGALYDVARTILKVKKMDKKIRNRLLNATDERRFMVPLMKSKDFKNIQNLWRIYIPFNKADLMRYKE